MPKKKDIEFADERKEPPIHKEDKWLRCDFTEPEMLDMGKRLARANERLDALAREKEEVVSAIKARASKIESEVSDLSQNLNKGYEYRDIECTVEYHKPENGKKTVTRLDTGELVEVTPMDAHEMQEQLPLQAEEVGA